MKTLYLTLDNKVNIQCVGFHYFNMYAHGPNDMINITFMDKQQMDKQTKLLNEYKFNYKVIREDGYPCISILSEEFIPYTISSVQEFNIWFDAQRYGNGRCHDVYASRIENNGNEIRLNFDIDTSERSIMLQGKLFEDDGIPCEMNDNKQLVFEFFDLINIKA